jgi:HAMP domain-containing protein
LSFPPGFAYRHRPRQQNDAISDVIGAACAIFVMGYSVFLAARVNRRLDEVQIAGQRFAQTKGMTIGIFAAVLVMIFPPSMNALVDLANTIAAGSPDKAVKYGIVVGYTLLMLLQGVGLVAVSIWWERRVFGGRE